MGALSRLLCYKRKKAQAAFERRNTGWDLQTIVVDTTAGCNLQCEFCSLAEWHLEKDPMSVEGFERLRDVLPRLRCVVFSNRAEPLLNRDLFRMIRIAKQATGGLIRTSFTTNGTIVDDEVLRGISNCGLDAIEVSMDGATEATYERIRKGARFDSVVRNVERLVQLAGRSRYRIPHVSLRFVLCESNAGELPDFIDLAHRLGVTQVVVNGLAPHSESMAGAEHYGPDSRSKTAELFHEVRAKAARLGMRLDLPSLVPAPVTHCMLVSNTCLIGADGLVAPCSMVSYRRPVFHRGERRENPQHTFGNINNSSLWEIWNSPEYTSFRQDVSAGCLPGFCEDCLHMSGVLCSLVHWRWLSS